MKFDIVAHSMGGLIARYYLRYGDQELENAAINWAGSENVDRLLLIAPPNFGSMKSLIGANDGYQGHSLLPRYSGAILSSFPSTYQLFPRDRHEKVVNDQGEPISIYNANLWKQNKWGFFNPQNTESLAALLPDNSIEERESIALEFLENCLNRAEQFHAALDSNATQPDELKVYLFSGDTIPTPEKIAAHSPNKENFAFEVIDWSPGDDTVTRSSSLSVERSHYGPVNFAATYFVAADHFALTRNGLIFEGLINTLMEKPGLNQP